MSTDSADPEKPGSDPDAVEESLNSALNDLETMLARRRHARAEHVPSTPTPAGTEQYAIPLLSDVVVPGSEAGAGGPAATTQRLDDDTFRRVVERLASEIEVIVQSRVEKALDTAKEDIRAQVRNHVEIMLPEILEDLVGGDRRDRE